MGSPRKTVPDETVVLTQDDLVDLLVLRCAELKIATSSTDKIEGVGSPWLHSLRHRRQRTTELLAIFPMLAGLDLEFVIRTKKAARKSGGTRVATKLRTQTRDKMAALTEAERAEAVAVLTGLPEPPPEVPEEIQAARKMAKQYNQQ